MFEKINNAGTEAGQKEEFSELKKEVRERNRNRKFLDKVLGRRKVYSHNIAYEKYYDEAQKENEEFDKKGSEAETNEGITDENQSAEIPVETIKKGDSDISQSAKEEEKKIEPERRIENIDQVKENLILLEKYVPFLESVDSSVRSFETALGNPELFGVLGLSKASRRLSEMAEEYKELSEALNIDFSKDDKELEKVLLSTQEKNVKKITILKEIIEVEHTAMFASVLTASGIIKSPLMPELDHENVFEKKGFQNNSGISGSLDDTVRIIRDFFSRNLDIDFHEIVPLKTKFDKDRHAKTAFLFHHIPEETYKQSGEASKKLLFFIYDFYKEYENKQEGLVAAVTTLGYNKNEKVCLKSLVASIDLEEFNYLLNNHIGFRNY